MKRYLLSIYQPDGGPPPPEVLDKVMRDVDALVAEHCVDHLGAPVMRIGGPEIPAMPYANALEAEYLVTADKLETTLRRLAEY